jgi:uncharacterized membrane protein YbaN (DUF454 family)
MVPQKSVTEEKKVIREKMLIAAAFLSLGFGIAGVFLPLLPTTPFVLLSAFCFLKSSRAKYEWLVNHRIFGKYIRDYITQRAMPLRSKISAISFMWLTMILSALLISNKYIALFLAVIGCAVTLHILSLRTVAPSNKIAKKMDDATP